MQFGKVDPALLNEIDFTLPVDHENTSRILTAAPKNTPTEIRIGCTSWVHPQWVGKIYPKGTKSTLFLTQYARQFNTVEFNGTYYNLPTHEQVETWCRKAGPGFKFCPKFTHTITHEKYLKNVGRELDDFLHVCEVFGEHLGPVFLMPHPQMDLSQTDTILSFVDKLPSSFDMFTEFRHPDFFTQPGFNSIFDALEKRQRGIVITDSAGRRDCVHMRLTTPSAFIRFVGNALHPSDYQRLDAWIERLGQWIQAGLQRLYFFVHQHDELHSPVLCKYMARQLNAKYGTNIKVPHIIEDLRLFD